LKHKHEKKGGRMKLIYIAMLLIASVVFGGNYSQAQVLTCAFSVDGIRDSVQVDFGGIKSYKEGFKSYDIVTKGDFVYILSLSEGSVEFDLSAGRILGEVVEAVFIASGIEPHIWHIDNKVFIRCKKTKN
jgi:hypothetical protein